RTPPSRCWTAGAGRPTSTSRPPTPSPPRAGPRMRTSSSPPAPSRRPSATSASRSWSSRPSPRRPRSTAPCVASTPSDPSPPHPRSKTMNVLVTIAEFLVNEFLSVPAYLIGLITAIGLIALRKSVGQVAGGALKAVLGLLLIGAGATLVTASLAPLGTMIQGALGAQGVVPTNEAIAGIAQEEFGAQVAWLMLLGFVVAFLLARFTPLRYVFLTGHHLLFMATLITIVMASAGMPTVVVVVLGALLLGILMVSLPALAQPWTRRITGDDSIAIGHFGTAGYIAAGAVGRLVDPKGKSRSTEDLKVPESLRFLRDSMVATALSIVLMYPVVDVAYLARAGQESAFGAFEGGATGVGNYLMQSVIQGLQFGIAVAVILFGVRTILGELVPAFLGIAAKVVPGAIPALDAPIVFPYAQNAVLIGFLSSFAGGLV